MPSQNLLEHFESTSQKVEEIPSELMIRLLVAHTTLCPALPCLNEIELQEQPSSHTNDPVIDIDPTVLSQHFLTAVMKA